MPELNASNIAPVRQKSNPLFRFFPEKTPFPEKKGIFSHSPAAGN